MGSGVFPAFFANAPNRGQRLTLGFCSVSLAKGRLSKLAAFNVLDDFWLFNHKFGDLVLEHRMRHRNLTAAIVALCMLAGCANSSELAKLRNEADTAKTEL